MNKFEKLISANSNSTLKRRAGIISNEAKNGSRRHCSYY